MNNAERILHALDARLDGEVDLTLYGRAALTLGFAAPRAECAVSLDVDAVLWIGQAEDLLARTNFWEAVDGVNRELAPEGLYISHFFTEEQVVLRPAWRQHRVPIPGTWQRLMPWRLGDADLLLSKLMRDDPLDQEDARFIAAQGRFGEAEIRALILDARVPDAVEVQTAFAAASKRLLSSL